MSSWEASEVWLEDVVALITAQTQHVGWNLVNIADFCEIGSC